MSPRRLILSELQRIEAEQGATAATSPSALKGYANREAKYQQAVNGLLKDRLINGQKGADGGMAIALNPARMSDVRRELRPVYANPVVLLGVVIFAGMAIAGVLL